MKVLLINGSPRKEGNTYTALMEVAQQLSLKGIDSEIFWIGNQPVRGCIACATCKKTGSGHCVFNDDVCNEVIDKMNQSDALVIGTPVYYGVPTGQVISLIQRMLYAGAKVEYKPFAAVVVCRRGGSTASFQTLQMPFQMKNMPIVTSQYWNVAFGAGEGQAAQDIEGMQTMRALADNMAWMLKNLNSGAEQKPDKEPWTPMNFVR